jgi:hypothetical protein
MRQLLLATAVALAAGCDFEGVTPGVQEQCATPTGVPLGCPRQPIEDSTDACLKLVGCGAIPVDNPEEEVDLVGCIEAIDGLEGFQLDFTLNCVEASTCDELKSAPTCFEHGRL